MIILVNGNAYETKEQKMIKNIVNIAKQQTKGTNSIYALKYTKLFTKVISNVKMQTILEMRNDSFKTKEELLLQVKDYKDNNIEAYYHLKEE